MKEEKIQEEASLVIRKAVSDLDTFYSKIKKSEKILKYRDDGHLVTLMFLNIVAMFSIQQILEISVINKMVMNESGKVLDRKERLVATLNAYQHHFDLLLKQHIGYFESETDE